MPHQLLRMIDANLNRCSEGLRVLEDVARFALNNAALSRELKALRHNLARDSKSLTPMLLSCRDSEHDVGRLDARDGELTTGETSFSGLPDLVRANARRVAESLRVIEELARLPDIKPMLNSASFEQSRFTLYSLERDLISRVSRKDKTNRIPGLYVILDRQSLAGRDELAVADQVIKGGARIIQLRDKEGKKRETLLLAERLRALCGQAGVLFIMNDHLDIAIAVDADGLHIGQDDLPLSVARRELPIDKVIGCSVTTVSQAIEAQEKGADYVAVGSMYPTATKREATVVGVSRLREVRRAVSTPLVAIGGIDEKNVSEVVAAGADAVAVISAVLGRSDIEEAVKRLVAEIEMAKEKCQKQ